MLQMIKIYLFRNNVFAPKRARTRAVSVVLWLYSLSSWRQTHSGRRSSNKESASRRAKPGQFFVASSLDCRNLFRAGDRCSSSGGGVEIISRMISRMRASWASVNRTTRSSGCAGPSSMHRPCKKSSLPEGVGSAMANAKIPPNGLLRTHRPHA